MIKKRLLMPSAYKRRMQRREKKRDFRILVYCVTWGVIMIIVLSYWFFFIPE